MEQALYVQSSYISKVQDLIELGASDQMETTVQNSKSFYSNIGKDNWCAFKPSNDIRYNFYFDID